jgi:drug/metabolite transporter (DMT)-like permease
VALMAVAGVGWGIYSLAGRGTADPLAATAWSFLLSVPFVLPLGLVAGVVRPDAVGIALAVVSGAVTSGLGYALWYAVLPRLGAARAAVAQLTVPVIAALGGAVLLAEVPGLRFWLASVLVLSGVALASLPYRPLTRRSIQ